MDYVTLIRKVATEMRTHEEYTQQVLVIDYERDLSRFLRSAVGWLEASSVELGNGGQFMGMSIKALVTTH